MPRLVHAATFAVAITGAFLTAFLGAIATAAAQQAPDTILYGGTVLTMEEATPVATAIAIAGDRILAVGDDDAMLALQSDATRLVDLEGRTVMPGFVDAHTHLLNDASYWGATIDEIQDLAFANGITTLGNLYALPEFVAEMEALDAAGDLRVRTSLYLSATDPCGTDLGDWFLDYAVNRDPEARLRILGVKLFADGGTCGRPAIGIPYADTGEHGDLFNSQDWMNAAIMRAHHHGYQVAIHAQGDLAIDQAMNAIAFALHGEPNDLRHRIEHNALIRDDQLPRYSEIGIVPTIFGTYFTCYGITDGGYEAVFGADNIPIIENWRRLLDANPGLIAAWHGDDPGVLPVSPILELYGLVTRSQVREETGEVCEAPDWLRAFGVDVETALRMMTINAAYALFMEDAVGSLTPGKFADLVILSDDPAAIDADAIKDIAIEATFLGGEAVFCAEGREAFCE